MDGRRKVPAPGSRTGAAWKGLLPVGVAAGVALVIGGGVDVVHHRQRAEKSEHAAKPAAKSMRTTPRYVVGVRGQGSALVVRDLRDGDDVGLPVAAPQGRRFQRISAAKNGTYVVSSYAARKVTFQRLELGKNGHPKDLEEIPRATVPGVSTPYSDLAVNPDGDRIAYVTYRGTASRVDVVSARTGARKAWTTKRPGRVGGLSWAGDILGFVWNPLPPPGGRPAGGATAGGATRKAGGIRYQMRTLDTRLPSGDLKVSKVALNLPPGVTTAVLSRDGRTVIAGLARNAQISLQAYAIGTRRPIKVVARQRSTGRVARLDADHTGGHLLVSSSDGRLYAEGAALPAGDLADAAW
ncbi:hypothetical protein E1298_27790 [Actinomadura rubrisoli]|uniref:Lactonase family protein n=2 Tax=Actinomadura rubrisoli TaxID=2530368 RepID=A0A4R5B0I3_9ACTN|nr:hypothetical protein E1298_27790 [Actinomadura rubrisoli]